MAACDDRIPSDGERALPPAHLRTFGKPVMTVGSLEYLPKSGIFSMDAFVAGGAMKAVGIVKGERL